MTRHRSNVGGDSVNGDGRERTQRDIADADQQVVTSADGDEAPGARG